MPRRRLPAASCYLIYWAEDGESYLPTAKTALSGYRNRFPTSEECFFNEVKEGGRYTVTCGLASGNATTVRAR